MAGRELVLRREIPRSRLFLWLAAAAGALSAIAVEAGWVVTEVGRQPWTVYGKLRTSEAVNPAPGLWLGFVFLTVIYVILTVSTVYVLRYLVRRERGAPQERVAA